MKQILTVLAAALLFLPFPILFRTGLAPGADAPLYGWLQSAAEAVFGHGPFAARIPNALAGILTVLTCFQLGKRRDDERFGMWWALILVGSWLPQLLFRSDASMIWGNYFLFLSIYLAYRLSWSTFPWRAAALSGVGLGIATLSAGLVAPVIWALTGLVYWTWKRFHTGLKWPQLLFIVMIAAVSAGWYYAWLGWRGGLAGLRIQPYASAGNSFSFHWLAMVACFPVLAFALTWLQTARTRSIYLAQPAENRDMSWWMWAMFWTGLLVLSVMRAPLESASLLHLPLAYLAAVQVHRVVEGRLRLRPWNHALLLILGIGGGLMLALLPLAGKYHPELLPTCFRPDADWHIAEMAYGILYMIFTAVGAALVAKKRAQEGLMLLLFGGMLLITLAAVSFGDKVQLAPQGTAVETKK
ncbi:ArnT family glycosyltransferase [Chitinophaga caseinilytica]|uniref:ArnT family glycosyltransferase n=1 Tax=Chitinophaga caseinilytica TaxID=2267521 RepID=UPI003C2C82EF